jgi:elongation factor Ts
MMAEITAAAVKELRETTGLGMMECKRALEEAGGDMKKAEDLLRIKSGAKASKAASRIAAEGVIGAYLAPDRKLGALVEVNCETDFVAKNQDFLAFAKGLAELVATENPADVAALGDLSLGGQKVESRRQALVQKIGENLAIRRFARIATAAKLAQYVHGVKIGVLVEFEGDDEVGKDLAMHVAFAKPLYLSRKDVPAAVVARERDILSARAQESGKPPDIVAKMVEGGINKFLGEITLLGQPFVKDDKQTVEKVLAARKSKLLDYRFFVVGEGIEKKATDFAAEVMAQAGLAAKG